LEVIGPFEYIRPGSTGTVERKKENTAVIFHQSIFSSAMNVDTGHDIFVNSTPANFHGNAPDRRSSRTSTTERPLDPPENRIAAGASAGAADFQTVNRVLDVLKEGEMDVVGFLDALCWGNELAIADPTMRTARTNLLHSAQLATVVLRWLSPPRTSQGGTRAEGAKRVLLPVAIKTVKKVINNEMDALVEELKEKSADITEQSVLGTVIDKVQEKVRVTAPVFYDLVKTAAWSKEQQKRNTLKEPTKVSMLCELVP
jgi:hypothetical protein